MERHDGRAFMRSPVLPSSHQDGGFSPRGGNNPYYSYPRTSSPAAHDPHQAPTSLLYTQPTVASGRPLGRAESFSASHASAEMMTSSSVRRGEEDSIAALRVREAWNYSSSTHPLVNGGYQPQHDRASEPPKQHHYPEMQQGYERESFNSLLQVSSSVAHPLAAAVGSRPLSATCDVALTSATTSSSSSSSFLMYTSQPTHQGSNVVEDVAPLFPASMDSPSEAIPGFRSSNQEYNNIANNCSPVQLPPRGKRERNADGPDNANKYLGNHDGDSDIEALFPSFQEGSDSNDDDNVNVGAKGGLRRRYLQRRKLNPFSGFTLSDRYMATLRHRRRLPVYEQRRRIARAILAHQVVILCGETGSGKSTQIPQVAATEVIPRLAQLDMLFGCVDAEGNPASPIEASANDDGCPSNLHQIPSKKKPTPIGYVACTQPRKVAAMSLAARVASEADVRLGNEVGYHVRFDNNTSRKHLLFVPTGEQSTAAYLEQCEDERAFHQEERRQRSDGATFTGRAEGGDASTGDDDDNTPSGGGLIVEDYGRRLPSPRSTCEPHSYIIPSRPRQQGERTAGGIVFFTDGTLVREFLSDRTIKHIKVIIIDEVHERSVNTDVLLGLVKDLIRPTLLPARTVADGRHSLLGGDNLRCTKQPALYPHPFYPGCFCMRPDLRVVIMSATLNKNSLVQFFTFSNPMIVRTQKALPPPSLLGGSPMLNRYAAIARRKEEAGRGYELPKNLFGSINQLVSTKHQAHEAGANVDTNNGGTSLEDLQAAVNSSKVAPYVIDVKGRRFPIQLHHSKTAVTDYIASAVSQAISLHVKEKVGRERRSKRAPRKDHSNHKDSYSSDTENDDDDEYDDNNSVEGGYSNGDVLIFLPGEREVDRCCRMITSQLEEKAAEVEAFLKEFGEKSARRAEMRRVRASGKSSGDGEGGIIKINDDDGPSSEEDNGMVGRMLRGTTTGDDGHGLTSAFSRTRQNDLLAAMPEHLKDFAMCPAAAVLPLFGSQTAEDQRRALLPAKHHLLATTHVLRKQHHQQNGNACSKGADLRGGKAAAQPTGGSLVMPVSTASFALSSRAGLVRKIICATNIAESSLTIDGVSYVIDCGLHRVARYNSGLGISTLSTQPISRASAVQRAGRAGRTAPGFVYRLYTKEDRDNLPADSTPEIQRVDITSTTLLLKQLGFVSTSLFPFPTPPAIEAQANASRKLETMGAVKPDAEPVCDAEGGGGGDAITALGKQLGSLPLSVEHGRALVAGARYGCCRDIAACLAMMECGAATGGGGGGGGLPRMYMSKDRQRDLALRLTAELDGNDQIVLAAKEQHTGAGFLKKGLRFHATTLTIADVRRKWFQSGLVHPDGGHLTLALVLFSFLLNRESEAWCDEHFLNYSLLRQAVQLLRSLEAQLKRLGLPVESQLWFLLSDGGMSNRTHPLSHYHSVLGQDAGYDYLLDTYASGGMLDSQIEVGDDDRLGRVPQHPSYLEEGTNQFASLHPNDSDDDSNGGGRTSNPTVEQAQPWALFAPCASRALSVRKRTPRVRGLPSEKIAHALCCQRASVAFRLALLEGLHENVGCRPIGWRDFGGVRSVHDGRPEKLLAMFSLGKGILTHMHSRAHHYGDEETFGGSTWVIFDALDVDIASVGLVARVVTRVDDPVWLAKVWNLPQSTPPQRRQQQQQGQALSAASLDGIRHAVVDAINPPELRKSIKLTLDAY